MPYKERLGDRRTELRFEIVGQLWGSVETTELLPLRNLTRRGALIESRHRFNADALRAVRLVDAADAADIQVRVRHVTPVKTTEGERYLIGVEFVDPSAGALQQIDRLVSARPADAPPVAEA
jgi:hypothetical protein